MGDVYVKLDDAVIDRAARAIRTLENGSDDFDALIKYQDQKIAGAVLQSLRAKARAALEAALPVSDRELLAKFATEQEPLGAEFEAVWDANVEKLYADDKPVSDGWEDIAINPPPANEVVLMCWYHGHWEVWEYEAGCYETGQRIGQYSNVHLHGQATHWRPLPAPPSD